MALFVVGFHVDIAAPWMITGYSVAQTLSRACLLALMREAIAQRQAMSAAITEHRAVSSSAKS